MSSAVRQTSTELIAEEMARYRASRRILDDAAAWQALERAHIVAQSSFVPHLVSHWHMLDFAVRLRDWREAAGQLLRLALVPLGSLTGRLPTGNTGRARISAFRSMPVPSDLAVRLAQHDKSSRHE